MRLPPYAYVLIFLAAFLAVEALLLLARSYHTGARRERRLRRIAATLDDPRGGSDPSILRRIRGAPSLIGELMGELPLARRTELLLYRAQIPLNPARFVLLSAALGLAGWLVGSIFFVDPGRAAAPALVAILPWIQARRRARQRREAFERQFPEALDLLTRAMRAGHSLTFGFQMVGQELGDPLGMEFSQVSEELKLGQDVRAALANLAYRVDSADLPFFVTAISIHRETGGNLAEVLEKLGYVIRERFKLFGKIRSFTAIGRASATLLALWPLVMVGALYMVNANYVSPLWEESQGRTLILASAAMVTVGYLACRRMATIEV